MTFKDYFFHSPRPWVRVSLSITLILIVGLSVWQALIHESGAIGVIAALAFAGLVQYLQHHYNKYLDKNVRETKQAEG